MAPTPSEIVSDAIKHGRLENIPGLLPLLEAEERAASEVEKQPLIQQEKARLHTERRQRLAADVEAAIAREVTARQRVLDQEAGKIHREAKALVDAPQDDDAWRAQQRKAQQQLLLEARAQTLISRAGAATDLAELRSLVDAAMLSEHDGAVRGVGAAVLARLDALGQRKPGGAETQATRAARAEWFQLAGELEDWRRAHPTASERLRRIERERERLEFMIRDSADYAVKFFGLGGIGQAGSPHVVSGRAFESRLAPAREGAASR